MTGDAWDPAQYDRFRAERRQPFFDLVALMAPVPGGRAIDLGCGTGELTLALHDHLGARHTIGIDRSAAMLADSARLAGDGVVFHQRDIATFPDPGGADGLYDVIAANASLHWLGDHAGLLARLTSALGPRGQLAFQVPANFDHPSHTVAQVVAAEPPFADALGASTLRGAAGDAGALDAGADPQPADVRSPEEYATILNGLGFSEQSVRLQVYGHVLASSAEVVEWVKGTLLTRYRERLEAAMYDAFVDRYRVRLAEALGDQRPYFYPFKRILCWARRP